MKKLFFVILTFAALCLGACATGQAKEIGFFAMDTYMTGKAYGAHAAEALDACKAEADRIEKMLSVTDPSSEIYLLNHGETKRLSAEAYALLDRTREFSEETNGAYDATLYPLGQLWGFTQDTQRVPLPEEIESALPSTGWEKLHMDHCTVTLPDGGGVDLGGAAKGYASQQMAEICSAHGVRHAILSLGGNVYAVGTRPDGSPWRVGVQDPRLENETIGTLLVSDTSVITAGAYQRFFERDGITYHHIMDPNTGYPASSGLLSVTVITVDGTAGDVLSTAMFVMGLDASIEYWKAHDGVEAVFVLEDGTVYYTENVPWESVSPYWHKIANNGV